MLESDPTKVVPSAVSVIHYTLIVIRVLPELRNDRLLRARSCDIVVVSWVE